MELILVRHGETLWNKEKRVQGISDIELSEFGLKQAERLAECLKSMEIEAIHSSPLKRAYQTAETIARFHEVEIEKEWCLRELDQGDFEGLTFSELWEKHSSFLRKWIADPASVVMPNGESLEELQTRAWGVIEEIIEQSKNTLVVSHNFTITTILCKFKKISPSKFRNLRVDVASKTFVEISDDGAVVKLLNDTCHLGKDI